MNLRNKLRHMAGQSVNVDGTIYAIKLDGICENVSAEHAKQLLMNAAAWEKAPATAGSPGTPARTPPVGVKAPPVVPPAPPAPPVGPGNPVNPATVEEETDDDDDDDDDEEEEILPPPPAAPAPRGRGKGPR